MTLLRLFFSVFALSGAPFLLAEETELANSVQTILSIGSEGAGNVEAAAAMRTLQDSSSVADLPLLFDGLNQASPISTNYFRAAIEALVDREPPPLSVLSTILMDPRQGDQSRLLSFQLLEKRVPEVTQELIPGFLSDPNIHLRQKAVEHLITKAESKPSDHQGVALLYQQALHAAREVDQISQIAKALEQQGHKIDLPKQFGFLLHWQIIGPFDNTDRKGFETQFPPETADSSLQSFPGKDQKVTWQNFASSHAYGKIDFNQPYGMLKESTSYARCTFESPHQQEVELRLGCKNAWKIWVNGEFVFGRDEYHRGQRIDQYKMTTTFQEGENNILVKCCQNEQDKEWTTEWEFQLRVCDQNGQAILSSNRLPTPLAPPTRRKKL